MRSQLFAAAVLFLLVLTLPYASAGATRYVDQSIPVSSCSTYSIERRSCEGGTQTAHKSLEVAEAVAVPGDTILVRQANVERQWKPRKSGESGREIVWRVFPHESVTLTDPEDRALVLSGLHDLTLDGFKVVNPVGLMLVFNSNHITIRNFEFVPGERGAHGRTGSVWWDRVTYSKLLDSKWVTDEAFDAFYSELSDHNLFAGNVFAGAHHTVFNISCGSFNIIRNNVFSNPLQKIAETFDCEMKDSQGKSIPDKLAFDNTKHNFWEANEFRQTPGDSEKYNNNGLQYCGQDGVTRNNVFYENAGGAIDAQSYAEECTASYNNRIYNNTFYANSCFAISATGSSGSFRGYQIKNNLFFRNYDCSGQGNSNQHVQLDDRGMSNCDKTSACGPAEKTGNLALDSDRSFANVQARPLNLHLRPESPAIDSGVFVTTVKSDSGKGTLLVLNDAGYFRDAFGIPGEKGDLIQLEGSRQTARIVAVDYATNIVTLDTELEWKRGQGISLAFEGDRPDAGALEYKH